MPATSADEIALLSRFHATFESSVTIGSDSAVMLRDPSVLFVVYSSTSLSTVRSSSFACRNVLTAGEIDVQLAVRRPRAAQRTFDPLTSSDCCDDSRMVMNAPLPKGFPGPLHTPGATYADLLQFADPGRAYCAIEYAP